MVFIKQFLTNPPARHSGTGISEGVIARAEEARAEEDTGPGPAGNGRAWEIWVNFPKKNGKSW